MATIGDMKELSDKFKLSVRSTGEVHEAITSMVARFRTSGEVLVLGKSTREGLVNAALMYIDGLPHDQKVEALRIGAARLEALMRGEDPGPDPEARPAKFVHGQSGAASRDDGKQQQTKPA